MNEHEFETLAERTLDAIATTVEDAAPDAEVDLQGGVLSIQIEGAGVFLVNKHAPLKQLWVSSPYSGAGHFAFDGKVWVNTRGGANMAESLGAELSRATGVTISIG